MTLWQEVTWTVARAGGVTAYLLLTLSVVLGLALSLKWQSPRWPRLINNDMHNFVTLLAAIFTGIHILAVIVDPYIKFSLADVFIPFVTQYRTLAMALGIVGLYLGIAIGISTWLRPRIGYSLWRKLHTLTIGVFALSAAHGIFTGSDSTSVWAVLLYAGSIAVVGGMFALRLLTPTNGTGGKRPAIATLVGMAVVACTTFTVWNHL